MFVWLCCAIYSLPRFFMFGTVHIPDTGSGSNLTSTSTSVICVMKQFLFNAKAYDTAQFLLCFLLPLLVISVIYCRISVLMWKTNFLDFQSNTSVSKYNEPQVITQSLPLQTISMSKQAMRYPPIAKNSDTQRTKSSNSFQHKASKSGDEIHQPPNNFIVNSSSSMELVEPKHVEPSTCTGSQINHAQQNFKSYKQRVIQSRKKVIKLLVTVVFIFAVCNAPHHIRKLWLHWSLRPEPSSNFVIILSPITWLFVYLNSALNPIIYALLSENFRRCMKETLFCNRICRINRIPPRDFL